MRLSKRTRGVVAAVIGLTVGIVGILYLIHSNAHQVGIGLHRVSLTAFILLCLTLVPSLLLRAEIWYHVLSSTGVRPPRKAVYTAASYSFAVNNINTVLGAATKIALLRRLAPTSSPTISQQAAAELPLAWIEASLAAVLIAATAATLDLPIWLAPLIILLTIGFLFFLRIWERRSERYATAKGLAIVSSPRQLFLTVALMACTYLIQLARMALVLHAVGITPQPFLVASAFVAGGILGTLPIGPSSNPAALAAVYSAHDVALALAAGVVLTVVSVFTTFLLALLLSPRLISVFRQRSTVKVADQAHSS